jgi:hypothetical protein
MFLLFIVASLFAGYYYNQNKELLKNPNKANDEKVAALVEKVGKLVLLPEGEVPTVAEVSDPEKLKSQPFFARAKVGDQVLLYAGAKKAVLYDPKANIILEMAALNIGK